MKNSKVSKTVMHKCVFSNQVHELLEPEHDKPAKERTPSWKRKRLTDQEKIEMFDKIVALHRECSRNIQKAQYERRAQKRKEKARQESGYYEKKAARKQAYQERKKSEGIPA